MQADIEQRYNDLGKKHALPDFALLDREFEVSSIEKPLFLLRAIRRKIAERLDDLAQFLEMLLQPDTNSFSSIFEYHVLTEQERKELTGNFQKLMALHRACTDAELAVDDGQDAAVISRAVQEWPGIRQAVRPFVQKIASAWPRPSESKHVVGYFG